MKTTHSFLKAITILIFVIATLSFPFQKIKAQTGYCTVLHQPCDSDGVLVTTVTSGLTPPLMFIYRFHQFHNEYVVHANVLTYSDTLFNITDHVDYIQVRDTFGNYLFPNSGIVPPFTIDTLDITYPICPSTNGTIQITINGGITPASVSWFDVTFDPAVFIGNENPKSLPNGLYMTSVTDINGCGYLLVDTISIFSISPVNSYSSTTDANCTNGTATIDSITGGTGPYTYLWSNGASTQTITGLCSGYYYCTVTDFNGCTDISYSYINQSVTINVNSNITNATCLNNNGSIISFGSGGTSPYTYLYSNGIANQTIGGLPGNSGYNVTVTDANGCTGVKYNSINTTTPITVNYSGILCSCNMSDGSVTLNISGGTPPYSVIWYTTPQQNGITISNMPVGQYAFKVTDATGCIRTGIAGISSPSWFYLSSSFTNPTCPNNNNGSISIIVYNSDNPPLTFLWSNGATTQSISNLLPGFYTCTITDNLGCTTTKCQTLSLISPVHIGFNVTPTTCLFNHDGSIISTITGGTPPYTLHWSNGQANDTITGLEQGNYWLNVIDSNGCSDWHTTYLDYNHTNDSCYCTITGRVFVDNNSNCIYDTGEDTVENIMIHCIPIGYTFTNNHGLYSFIVPTGNYTLSESVQYIYPLAPCQNNSIPISVTANTGCIDTIVFANIINPLHDIHLRTTNFSMARPGLNYYQALIVENDGTITESNIQLSNRHDGQLQYISTSPVAFTQPDMVNEPNWYNISSGFPTLTPGQSIMLLSNYFVPTNIPLATNVDFWDTTAYNPPMNNWLLDYTPWNNVNDTEIVVVGPYDPNYKEVSPKGIGSQGYISYSDSVLDFIIHFQNIGNYYAQNVVVIDTLDSDLNLSTLRPGFSNKNYIAEVSENGILKFTFSNIHLYPQSYNELLSCGFVCYSIKQNPSLSLGTQIKNSADIYFDFNSPVKTNTTINTIHITSVRITNSDQQITVYPNPTSSELFINSSEKNLKSIRIYDMTGRLLFAKEAIHSSFQSINVEKLTNSIYFIEIEKANGGKLVSKFIKN